MPTTIRLILTSLAVAVAIVIGVTLGPVAMLSVLVAVGIFAAPIVVAVIQRSPKAAIESAPKTELDPNDFDPRVNWPLVNQIEAEVGFPISRHPDECRCSLCATQDPPKFVSNSSMYVPLPYKPGAVVTPIKDNARAQVKDASIISQGALYQLRITYTDDTRQISNYATYALAKEHMAAVMAYSSYSLRGLDMPALPKDQHAANNDCSCVICNPTFGITPAESCIRNSCTCRYCDPDTTAPVMNCRLTGKAAPMLPSPFRDMPALHTYRDANIGSLTRAVLSCKLTEKQYHKLAKKYFDGDKSQARLVLSSALNDHYTSTRYSRSQKTILR